MNLNIYEPIVLDQEELLKRLDDLEESAQRDYDRGVTLDKKQAVVAKYKLDVYHTVRSLLIGGDHDGD